MRSLLLLPALSLQRCRSHVRLAHSLDNNDFKLWHSQVRSLSSSSARSLARALTPPAPCRSQYGSTRLWAEHCLDAVRVVRDEALAGKRHGYVTIALHTRWVGRAGRFAALKKMVEDIVGLGDVWFATREQIARHWIEQYPYGSLPRRESTA